MKVPISYSNFKELSSKRYAKIKLYLSHTRESRLIWRTLVKNGLEVEEYIKLNGVAKTAPMTFVDLYMQHTKHYESPGSFWKWSAYTTIGAILRDNCFRRLGDVRIFPNVYTLLVADSAVHRKGHPVKLCEELVKSVKNTKLISGRASIQGILDELARGETDKKTGKVTSGGAGLFCAGELSAGIVNDPEAIKIMTDIYDFKDEYTSRLRGSGVFRIKNVCFSMIAASNEELLRDVYDGKAIFGGLLGRTFLVRPNEFRPGNSLFNVRDQSESFKIMLEILTGFSKLEGEFEITNGAESAYDDWYIPFRKSYEHKSDRSGISGRIHTSVLKLAMILAVNRTGKLLVEKEHIKEAITECMGLLPNYQGFVMASGKSTVAEVASLLIEDIWNSRTKSITKSEFLGRYIHMFDNDLLDKCILTLSAAELIKLVIDIHNSKETYTVTEKCKEKFQLK